MTGETIIYNQKVPNKTFDIIERSLELQKMILDPDPNLSERTEKFKQKLIARSAAASTTTNKRLTVEDQLQLQEKILGNE